MARLSRPEKQLLISDKDTIAKEKTGGKKQFSPAWGISDSRGTFGGKSYIQFRYMDLLLRISSARCFMISSGELSRWPRIHC